VTSPIDGELLPPKTRMKEWPNAQPRSPTANSTDRGLHLDRPTFSAISSDSAIAAKSFGWGRRAAASDEDGRVALTALMIVARDRRRNQALRAAPATRAAASAGWCWLAEDCEWIVCGSRQRRRAMSRS
jgi:hypothetical protein